MLEASSQAVDFEALTDTEFVLGSAAPHEHDLVLGNYSVRRARFATASRTLRRLPNACFEKGVLGPAERAPHDPAAEAPR